MKKKSFIEILSQKTYFLSKNIWCQFTYYFRNESTDSLKIVDFGLSASTKSGKLTMRCGSPGYVAPEILNDNGYDCKADVFSAGIILYIL